MDTSASTGPDARLHPARRGAPAFTLVEVTLSLGIMAFALLAVFGLLPVGMNSFRQAKNLTVGGQIAQRVINEAQQSDFDQLLTDASGAAITVRGTKAPRYFDDQGDEVIPANVAALAPAERQRILYWVNTRVLAATAQPSGASPPQSNANVATVTVQVLNNPAGQTPAPASGTQAGDLWSSANSVLPLTTRAVFVARNQ